MQTETGAKSIIEFLRVELQLQRRHYGILREQYDALIANDRPRFASTQIQYCAFLVDAKLHADNRSRIVGGASPPLKQRMLEWSERDRIGGIAIIEAIRDLLVRIQLISHQNAKMIENELRYGKFMLDLYVEASRKRSNYAKRGLQPAQSQNLLFNQIA